MSPSVSGHSASPEVPQQACPSLGSQGFLASGLTWRLMGSYKWGYKQLYLYLVIAFFWVLATYNPASIYPEPSSRVLHVLGRDVQARVALQWLLGFRV